MQQMTKKFNQPTLEDLIATIGYGGIMPTHIVPKIRDLYEKEVKKIQKEAKEEVNDIEKHNISDAEYKQKRKKNNSQGIVVKGLDNILIRFAKCCNPLPGDDIIGYVTKGRGVAIHRADCPNATSNGDFFQNRLVDLHLLCYLFLFLHLYHLKKLYPLQLYELYHLLFLFYQQF